MVLRGGVGWSRVGRVVDREPWEMISLGSWAGPGSRWKTQTSQDQTGGTSGLESSSRLRFFQLQETGSPLLLPSLKTGPVELRGLGPQSRSHPITFEITIIHDLEKIRL